MRDIVVVRDDPARHREIVDRVRHDIDLVLVHGDPALIPFEASFPPASRSPTGSSIPAMSRNTAPERRAGVANAAETSEVLVSAGGGAAGKALLETALAARRAGCLAHLPWRLITGTNLPDSDFAMLRANAPAGVIVERFREDFATLLRACRVSVSQAGYNTVLDLLAARARAVLVPFAAGRETEQPLRAERLAALGAAELVRESELSAGGAGRGDRARGRTPAAEPCDRHRRGGALGPADRRDDWRSRGRRRPFCRTRKSSYYQAMTSPPRLGLMPSAALPRMAQHSGERRGLGRAGRRA